jgi:Na+-driven multidrug efflux pump
MGLGMGMLPLIAYNFGAKQIERVGEVIIKALLTSFIWGALCWVVFMLFPNQIISIFNSDSNFLVEGTQALRIFTLVFFIVGMQMNLGVFFQGIGKGLPSLVLALARHVIFLVPALLILPRMFGLTGLWATFPIADILSAMLSLFWAGIQFRKLGIPFRLRYN